MGWDGGDGWVDGILTAEERSASEERMRKVDEEFWASKTPRERIEHKLELARHMYDFYWNQIVPKHCVGCRLRENGVCQASYYKKCMVLRYTERGRFLGHLEDAAKYKAKVERLEKELAELDEKEEVKMMSFKREALAFIPSNLCYAFGLEWKVVNNAVSLMKTEAKFNPYLQQLREAAAAKKSQPRYDYTFEDILALAVLALADGEPDKRVINLLICAWHDVNHPQDPNCEAPVYDWGDRNMLKHLVPAAGLEKEFVMPKEPEYVPPPPRDPDATTWVEDDYEGSVGYGPSVLG